MEVKKKILQKQLRNEVMNNNVQNVRKLLEKKDDKGKRIIDVNYKYTVISIENSESSNIKKKFSSIKTTLLSHALVFDQYDIVKLFLQCPEMDVNDKTDDEFTILTWSVLKRQTDIVKLLLNHPKIDVNMGEFIQRDTALMYAVNYGYVEIVKLLLNHSDININIKNKDNMTALLFASSENQYEIGKLLLNQTNIDVNTQNILGYTALMYAVKMGNTEFVKILLNHPKININLKNKENLSALMIATLNDNEKIVKLLLDKKNSNGERIVDVNVKSNVLMKFSNEYIVSKNTNVTFNDRNIKKVVKMDISTPLIMAASSGNIEIVKLLLRCPDIKINETDDYRGYTALMNAASK